ncbi:ferric reductase-like transmembrane domain-containing protein [Clostridium frigidicarnis]|uniref:DMSO/TMAO reductase YedYZ, heme-binding membrane subunit n=1 Tax=Clostridium frigidicarnis TaxID=84698 RepID=A0A1I0ZPL1_9CLOT|nr:ferric reductase-like transmembrane domain-containing protein [Clostridium frigidicarnis]SFB26083.1 DMSO/TMAO reductase YedYZ, heme-binding membrane subunit [Clostridium frigidicarnis]
MNLIYSLIFVIGLALVFTKSIKKNNHIYYSIATIIAISTIGYEILRMTSDMKLYGLISYFEKASIKGIFSIAFFVLVMFAGALNTKWSITRKLLNIRAELAIIASILMLPHGIIYLVRFIIYSIPKAFAQKPFPITYLSFIVIGIIAFILMIPLFITSFKKVRRKMKATQWKKLQRWSYLFYFLAYIHVLLILLNGKSMDWLKLSTYTIIFGSYAVLKLSKVYMSKRLKASKVTSLA